MDCDFETNVYSTFNAHKSRSHNQTSDIRAFKPEIVSQLSGSAETIPDIPVDDLSEEEDIADTDVQDLYAQLEHNLASLFLEMQAILNLSENAVERVIQRISQLLVLSEPLTYSALEEVLKCHHPEIESTVIKKAARAVTKSNIFLKDTSTGANLSTSKRRESFFVKDPLQ